MASLGLVLGHVAICGERQDCWGTLANQRHGGMPPYSAHEYGDWPHDLPRKSASHLLKFSKLISMNHHEESVQFCKRQIYRIVVYVCSFLLKKMEDLWSNQVIQHI